MVSFLFHENIAIPVTLLYQHFFYVWVFLLSWECGAIKTRNAKDGSQLCQGQYHLCTNAVEVM